MKIYLIILNDYSRVLELRLHACVHFPFSSTALKKVLYLLTCSCVALSGSWEGWRGFVVKDKKAYTQTTNIIILSEDCMAVLKIILKGQGLHLKTNRLNLHRETLSKSQRMEGINCR